jgi:hypothetical protein
MNDFVQKNKILSKIILTISCAFALKTRIWLKKNLQVAKTVLMTVIRIPIPKTIATNQMY